ncbi:MAG: zinc ribbon domain-containing protein [Eubacterium sp.]
MICKNCGHVINDGDLFCENCGTKVTTENEDKVNDNPNPDKEDDVLEGDNDFDPYSFAGEDSVVSENDSENVYGYKTNEGDSKSLQSSVGNAYSNSNNIKTIRFNKKAAIIIFVVIVILVIGIAVGYLIWNRIPVKINMCDYISSSVYNDSAREEYYEANNVYEGDYNTYEYEDYYYPEDEYTDEYYEEQSPYYNYDIGPGLSVYGYNEYASISEYELQNVIDWEALERDLNEKLSKKKRIRGEHLTFNDFISADAFTFTADKLENLKNDDIVTVSVSSYVHNYEGVEVQFNGCEYGYTISDLQVVNAFDPFEYVDLVLYGANGYAQAKCVVDNNLNQDIEGVEGFKVSYYDDRTIAIEKDGYIVSKINFYLNSEQEDSYFKNDDIVTVFCNSSSDLTTDYSLYIASYSKEYTVSGLGEYITKSTTISNEDLEKFKTSATNVINTYYATYDSYSGFKFNSAYIADLKEKSDYDSYHNSLCLIYSYTYTSWNDETETRYLYVMFENVIMSPEGTISFTPEDYYDSVNSSYESTDEIISNKFDDYYNLTKIA